MFSERANAVSRPANEPAGLHVDIRTRGVVDILDVTGGAIPHQFDLVLTRRLNRLLDSGSSLFVLNLTDLLFLDSELLGQMVACRERVRKRRGLIKLVLTRSQADLLIVSGLDRLFEMFLQEDDALDSFEAENATAGVP